MQNIQPKRFNMRMLAGLMLLCFCFGGLTAGADGVMPKMPAPPTTPVYWQLTSITHAPSDAPVGNYSIQYDVTGLTPNLEDALMAESLQMNDDATQGMTLTISRDGEAVMAHHYQWTPLPIYMVPNAAYTIDVQGSQTTDASSPNSLLGIYVLGDRLARISAGGYTDHADTFSFEIGPDIGLYADGSIVVDFRLRDSGDMFSDHITFTYTMMEGAKPMPTPIPGFVPVDLPDGFTTPAHYVPVEGQDGLWQIITAPGEYRAYGSMSGSEPSFFPADAQGRVVMDERPADPDQDFTTHVKGFVAEQPETVPPQYTTNGEGNYTFITRDGEVITRVYGRIDGQAPGFYPIDETGEADLAADAVTADADFDAHVRGFGSATPDTLPAHYIIIEDGLYSFIARDGQTHHRAYGRLNGEDPAFYPADAEGRVAEDAQPVQPDEDFNAYIKGFDPVAPEGSLPAHYYIAGDNLYAIDDRDGAPVYRVYGVKDGQAPAFYPADGQGSVDENAQPVTPEDDYNAHVRGFVAAVPDEAPAYYEATEVPGVWGFVDKDGQTHHRVYGSLHRGEAAFYPADAEGNVAGDALPVQPASDLAIMPPPVFAPGAPGDDAVIPAQYSAVEGKVGVYTFETLEGETVYRAYGAYGKDGAAFYPADEEGNPLPDSKPVSAEDDYTQYFAAFEAQAIETLPTRYEIVGGTDGLYTFPGRDMEPVYRVYGAMPDGTAAFYPADEHGNLLNGKPVAPEDDIDLMAPVIENTIATPVPQASPDNTPIVRTDHGKSEVDLLISDLPSAVSSVATGVPPTATNEGIARQFTPAPDATPELIASVTGQAATESTADPLTRTMDGVTPEPSDAQTPPDETLPPVEDETPAPEESATTQSEQTAAPAETETAAPAPSATMENTETSAPVETETPTPTPSEPPLEAESSFPWWIVIAGGVVVLGGGGYFLFKRKK